MIFEKPVCNLVGMLHLSNCNYPQMREESGAGFALQGHGVSIFPVWKYQIVLLASWVPHDSDGRANGAGVHISISY